MNTILLIDDDKELAGLLKEYLESEDFSVTLAHNGEEGKIKATSKSFDAIVLDVMMPIMNGMDALAAIRKSSETPVLMLTAKGETSDRIAGLELGADDYLPKPCNPKELVARLRAILRRTQPDRISSENQTEITVNDLHINLKTHVCEYESNEVNLTGAEFTVLEILMNRVGDVISKEVLTERALNRKLTPYDRSIDVHVSNIRKKLTQAGASKDLIINIRGAGYMLTLR